MASKVPLPASGLGSTYDPFRPMPPYPAVWTKKGCVPKNLVVTVFAMSASGRQFMIAAHDQPPQVVSRNELTMNSVFTPMAEQQAPSGEKNNILTLDQIEQEMRERRAP